MYGPIYLLQLFSFFIYVHIHLLIFKGHCLMVESFSFILQCPLPNKFYTAAALSSSKCMKVSHISLAFMWNHIRSRIMLRFSSCKILCHLMNERCSWSIPTWKRTSQAWIQLVPGEVPTLPQPLPLHLAMIYVSIISFTLGTRLFILRANIATFCSSFTGDLD